jgi:hypothetical protein
MAWQALAILWGVLRYPMKTGLKDTNPQKIGINVKLKS